MLALDSCVALARLRRRDRRCGHFGGTTGDWGEGTCGRTVFVGEKGLPLRLLRRGDRGRARSLRLCSLSRLPRRAGHRAQLRGRAGKSGVGQTTSVAAKSAKTLISATAVSSRYRVDRQPFEQVRSTLPRGERENGPGLPGAAPVTRLTKGDGADPQA